MSDELVQCCPDCSETRIRSRGGSLGGLESRDWQCEECGEEFETPNRRAKETPGAGNRHGLARELLDGELDT
jgi:ribosomal protein L37AE/L43A